MPTVHEILRDKVTLDIRSVDRVLLNGWVKNLQMPGGVVTFIREQRGWAIPSPVMLSNLTAAFRSAVEQFASARGLEIVDVAKGASKEERARAALARFAGASGVVLIGKAQEEASSFKGRRDDRGSKVWFRFSRERVWVTHYYFYVLDEDFGLAFIKVCTYLPFEVKVCLNGHAWAKQHLAREGVAFEALDNGFAACADPGRLQAICHHLTAEAIQAFFDRWVDRLPWPLSADQRAAGYRHDLSIWQLEVSRTQVFADPEQGRALVEALIRENLDRGRPDRVRLVFGRQVTKRTPSEFHTQVIQHGVIRSIKVHDKHSALKQDLKDNRALRTEMMINNPYDFGCPRGIAHFAELVALGQAANLGDYTVTVNGVQDPAQLSQPEPAPAKYRWVAVDVTITNRSSQAISLENYFGLKLADDRGIPLLAAFTDDAAGLGSVAPGEKVQARIIYGLQNGHLPVKPIQQPELLGPAHLTVTLDVVR